MTSAEMSASSPVSIGKCVLVTPSPRDADFHPHERSGHCCVTDGTNLYLFGGYHPEVIVREPGSEPTVNTYLHKTFRDLWSFNLATKRWQKVETTGEPPLETASMSMVLSGNTLILFGGTAYPWGSVSNDRIYTMNLREKRWRKLKCAGNIPAKYGQAMTLHEGGLYVYGGCRKLSEEDYLFDSELYHLDTRSQEWSLILPRDCEPALASVRGMYRHGLACYGEKLYVIGSSWDELMHIYYFSTIHIFDLVTCKWSCERTLLSDERMFPQRRAYHSFAQWGSEVYISGGHDNRKVFDDVWCLHLLDLKWQKLRTTLPVPSFFHSATITDTKCMYLFGGMRDLDERERTSVVQRVWLGSPPLAELCWQRLLQQCPAISDWSKEECLNFGIPHNFVSRLRPVR